MEPTPATPKLSYAELLAKFDLQEAASKADKAKIAELEASKTRNNTISFKVRAKGERYTDSTGIEREGKGSMSMYGLGRFPVSLYRTQWLKLVEAVKTGAVEKALEEHKGKLSERD